MTINERIKAFRKEKKLSQKQFAASIGVTQSGVSYMEQSGSTVSDSAIKTICSVYSLNESWLRDGTEPMSIELDTFNLDQYARERGASELELELAKVYFDLPKNVREQMLAKLIGMLNEERKAASLVPVVKTPREMTDEDLHAELDRQIAEERKKADGMSASGRGSSGTVAG